MKFLKYQSRFSAVNILVVSKGCELQFQLISTNSHSRLTRMDMRVEKIALRTLTIVAPFTILSRRNRNANQSLKMPKLTLPSDRA